MDALGIDALDHSHLRGLLISMAVAFHSLLALLLVVLAQFRRGDGQPKVIFLGGSDVHLNALANAALVDLWDIIEL